jgi:DNA processing protein
MSRILPAPREARALMAPLARGDLDDDRALRMFAAATWSCIVEPGDSIAGRLVDALGHEAALGEVIGGGRDGLAREAAAISAAAWQQARDRWLPRLDRGVVRDALQRAARAGIALVTPEDAAWPAVVDDLGEHRPLVLWVRGDVGALGGCTPSSAHSVALVGARAATSYGEHVSMELSADLVGRGMTIVSGAAYGIDGAAHRAALTAGGTTVALLAGGADRPYPSGHAQLIERIAASGAVVSEVPCGSPPTKWRFLQRNRLIAALAGATVVVEAGARSGSLNTAGHAAALARPLGAVPGPVTSAASAGCHRLLREFDARCVTNADEVMELLGAASPALFDMPSGGHGDRTDDTTRVRDAMSFRSWRQTADIARRSGLSSTDVTGILGLMALEGEAVRGDGGWRRTRAETPAG